MENNSTTGFNIDVTDVKAKLIFNASLMKFLIEEKHMQNQLIGLKANRENHDRCVFVMIDSIELRDAMQEYTKERRKARAERRKAEEENAETAEDEVVEGPMMED